MCVFACVRASVQFVALASTSARRLRLCRRPLLAARKFLFGVLFCSPRNEVVGAQCRVVSSATPAARRKRREFELGFRNRLRRLLYPFLPLFTPGMSKDFADSVTNTSANFESNRYLADKKRSMQRYFVSVQDSLCVLRVRRNDEKDRK